MLPHNQAEVDTLRRKDEYKHHTTLVLYCVSPTPTPLFCRTIPLKRLSPVYSPTHLPCFALPLRPSEQMRDGTDPGHCPTPPCPFRSHSFSPCDYGHSTLVLISPEPGQSMPVLGPQPRTRHMPSQITPGRVHTAIKTQYHSKITRAVRTLPDMTGVPCSTR
jgi:hypothetical protein